MSALRPGKVFGLSRNLRRAAFALYTAALLAATHWPNLRLPPVVPRTDLWLHAGVMAGWTILFALAEWTSARWRQWGALALTAVVAYTFAAVDELTQGIPGLNRIVDWSDLWANWLGVSLAMAALIASRLSSPRPRPQADTSSSDHAAETTARP